MLLKSSNIFKMNASEKPFLVALFIKIILKNKAYGFFSNSVSTISEDEQRLFGNVGLLLLNFFSVKEKQIRVILEKMAKTKETVDDEEKRIAEWLKDVHP